MTAKLAEGRSGVDWLIIASFSVFAFVSIVFEAWIALPIDLEQATDPFGRAWYFYASRWDPMLLHAPLSMRIMFAIDAWVFGPFYLVLVYAFVKRRNWIRMPALLYTSAMIYSLVVYDAMEILGPWAPHTDLPMVLLISLPYRAMPLLLAYRLRRPEPFGPA
jgi:hypothetical protein